jgi:hypothetical protein
MTTSTTNIAALNNDLLNYLKGAEVGMAIVAINLRGAADLDGELQGMAEVVGTIRGLLGELIEDLVDRMDADQAVEDAIVIAEASMGEAAGAAAEFEAADEAERLKAADEAVVEAMRERLMENAAWAAANPDLAAPGFVLNVLWIGLGNPTREEVSELIRGNIGAISADIELIHPGHFDDAEDGFVTAVCEHACRFDHDVIAGDFSADQALQLGIAVAQDEEPYGVRFAVRKDGGGFRIFMV